jgi:transposase
MPPRRSFGTEISGNISKKPHLSPAQRQTIIAKFDAGVSVRQLAGEFERGVQNIRDTIKKWNLHQTTSELPRSGRKPILSLDQKSSFIEKLAISPRLSVKI